MTVYRTRAARHHPASLPSGSGGAVLFISLIVLVAMTLAGIAIMRSVSTSNLIAGNLAFKQMTIQASDNGVEQAYQWLLANRAVLINTNAALGYYSSRPGTEPNWTDPNVWANAVTLPADAAGNTVAFIVHRMCTQPDTAYNASNAGVANDCALSISPGTPPPPGEGDSFQTGAPVFLQDPMVYYRITVRTTGQRNTISIVQAMVAIAL
jgi:Tfp pilus assembly protein PilX